MRKLTNIRVPPLAVLADKARLTEAALRPTVPAHEPTPAVHALLQAQLCVAQTPRVCALTHAVRAHLPALHTARASSVCAGQVAAVGAFRPQPASVTPAAGDVRSLVTVAMVTPDGPAAHARRRAVVAQRSCRLRVRRGAGSHDAQHHVTAKLFGR